MLVFALALAAGAMPLAAQRARSPQRRVPGAAPRTGTPRGDSATPATVADLAIRFAGMTAVTGYEQTMIDTLVALVPGARRDRAGNAVLVLGTGEPRRLVACPVDEPGYAVAGIRPDGYLTLRAVPGRVPAGFDRQLEGHRVTVSGAAGPVVGVVAVRSIHLAGGRASSAAFTADSAIVDIGAKSAEAVARVGVRMLSPVTLAKRPYRYGAGLDLLAAPMAGARAACAALAGAAVAAVRDTGMTRAAGTVVVAWTVERRLGDRGLGTLSRARGPFAQTLVLAADAGRVWPNLGTVERRTLPVRYPGSAVETVSLAAADSLRRALGRWIGGQAGTGAGAGAGVAP